MNRKRYKVKICGTTSIRDAQMAADAGADYLGVLVDVPGSERSLTLDKALVVAESSRIPVVILLLGKPVEDILPIVETIKPFAIHLLGETSVQKVRELKAKLDCQVWLTVYLPDKSQAEANVDGVKNSMKDYEKAGADTIVIDTMTLAPDGSAGRYGGTGKVGDWDAAKSVIGSVRIPVFLAGGINPDNVQESIRKVNPYGVDLASGVEESKCHRDPEKTTRLVQEVRDAEKRTLRVLSHSPEFTRSIGEEVGRRIFQGSLMALCGDLGTGKTVFAKGIAAGLGITANVTSPTFVIINEYAGKYPFYHIDTYRLNSSKDMLELGYEEYFYGDGVTAVEWAQKIEDLLPEKYLRIELEVAGESDREMLFIPFGDEYVQLIENLKKWLEEKSDIW